MEEETERNKEMEKEYSQRKKEERGSKITVTPLVLTLVFQFFCLFGAESLLLHCISQRSLTVTLNVTGKQCCNWDH